MKKVVFSITNARSRSNKKLSGFGYLTEGNLLCPCVSKNNKPYIQGFKENDTICFFENYGGFWAYQEPELSDKIKEFEKEHNCLVYAVTHEYLEFGECYDFLYIPDYKEEWDDMITDIGSNKFYAFAYVWNKDDEYSSEFGSIGIRSFGGGIKRIM